MVDYIHQNIHLLNLPLHSTVYTDDGQVFFKHEFREGLKILKIQNLNFFKLAETPHPPMKSKPRSRCFLYGADLAKKENTQFEFGVHPPTHNALKWAIRTMCMHKLNTHKLPNFFCSQGLTIQVTFKKLWYSYTILDEVPSTHPSN